MAEGGIPGQGEKGDVTGTRHARREGLCFGMGRAPDRYRPLCRADRAPLCHRDRVADRDPPTEAEAREGTAAGGGEVSSFRAMQWGFPGQA